VSWQLTTWALLAVVLVGGFAWYERERPPARLVALVAVLAALAVAGRLVLAPLPNVVATTDIALITGYALGGAPGFVVGALAAPVSNIWLGQGPWTVWQMGGWGLAGLLGAWLALAGGREIGRLRLAVACGAAGFAYGALLDLSVMVTYGGEQSLDRYLALSARGLPFNLAHAAGNFAIALAAGPALVRMIARYRTRMEFTWRPAAALPCAVVALATGAAALSALSSATPAPATAQVRGEAAARASTGASAAWLIGEQNPDGGFAAVPGGPSSPAMTGWAMLGLEAAGRNPLDLREAGRTPVSYLHSQVDRLRSTGDLERTIIALEGAGLEPRDFAGTDLVAELRSRRDGDGSVDGQTNLTAFYVLAMRATGVDSSELSRSADWLRRAQGDDGGWGFQPQAPSDPDSTGATVQALAAAGSGGGSLSSGVRYLHRAQQRGGGFALSTSGVVNSQSTAWAIQGLVAAGAGGEPLDDALGYVERLRSPDGHYSYSSSSDQTPIWVTAQVLLAVARAPFPLAAVPREAAASRGPQESGEGEGAGPGSTADPGAPTPSGQAGEPAGAEGPSRSARGGAARGEEPRSGSGSGGERGDPAGQAAGAGERATSGWTGYAPVEAQNATLPAAAGAARERQDEASRAAYVAGGLTLLAVALGAGFLWYRRRS
jgi:energy-coupling factor transport system substrate-specific component